MTPPDPVTPPGSGSESGGREVADQAKEETRQLANRAGDEAQRVSETAKDEARRVTDDVTEHARDLVSTATDQVRHQAEEQTAKLAGTLSQLGEQVHALAEGRSEEAGDADRYARQLADGVSQLADRIEHLGASGVVDEVQRFARRRPGAFLAGAAAAGVVVSRLLRNAGGQTSSGNGAGGAGRIVAPSRAGVKRPTPPTPPVASPPPREPVAGPAGDPRRIR